MASYQKNKLSGSTSGKPIKVAATAIASGTTIHTAVSGSTAFDEITIFASNLDSSARTLTIGWGGTTDPDDLICKGFSIPANTGPVGIATLILNGGLIVKAAADSANLITISGWVNNIA